MFGREEIVLFFVVLILASIGLQGGAAQTPKNPRLKRAVLAYGNGQIQKARATLDSVSVERLSDKDASIYHLYRGFLQLVFGREQEARRHFRQSVRLDPEVQPSPTLFAPGRIAVYREVRKSVKRLADLTLTPDSTTLTAGDSLRLRVSGELITGTRVDSPDVDFSVAPRSAASITPGGWLRTDPQSSNVTVKVLAQAQGVSDTSFIQVERALKRLVLRPERASLNVGETLDVDVTAVYQDGSRVEQPGVSWSSNRPSVVTVANGTAVARAAGSATITASFEGRSSELYVEVQRSVADLSVTPAEITVQQGTTAELQATPLGSSGRPVEVPVEWEVVNTSVAEVASNGTLVARKPGRTVVIARSGGVTARIPVRVRQVRVGDGVAAGTAFMTGLLFPGLGNYVAGQPAVGIPVTLLAGGAAAVGVLSKRVREFCAVEASKDCPPSKTLKTTEKRHLLVPGLAVAGGVALIGALTAAIGAGGSEAPAGGQAAAQVSDGVRVPLSVKAGRNGLGLTLISVDLAGVFNKTSRGGR